MHKVLDSIDNKRVAYIEDIKSACMEEDLSSKELCIIKTDFKNLNPLKKLIKDNPKTEFWITSNEISRKNIMQANTFGIKNVLPYPFDLKIVRDFFKKKLPEPCKKNYFRENSYWMKDLKVMIVDDNPMNIELLSETLKCLGLNIQTFYKPQEALDILLNNKFDLFLLDIMMPDISGFDLAKLIKNSEINKDVPIVFISALSDSENKITGYDLGSIAYIEKPFDVNVVRSQVFNILKSYKLQDAMNKTKESFVAMVAHDLKSPVNAEITALEMLLKNFQNHKDTNNDEIITDLLQAAKYMKNLVDNILYKYKFENNKVILNKTKYSLNTLIKECIAEIKYFASDKEQKIIYKNTTKQNTTLVDCIEIKRVIHNLLSNAIEHTPRNSYIDICLYEIKDYFVIQIENTINGMPPNNIDEIFNEFVSFANKSKCVNSGLGLFVSKNIIEAHNGEIKAEIIKKDKIRFKFTIPKI